MKYLRFDSVGGASGDMILSALVALGADINSIEKSINALLPEPLHFHTDKVADAGLNGLCVTVHAAHHPHPHPEVWPDAHEHHHTHEHAHEHPHTHEHAHEHHHTHEHAHEHHHTHEHAHEHHHDHPHQHDHAHTHHHNHPHRGLNEIRALLVKAPISEKSRALALAVFQELAVAEAHIHGKTPETVHFHEVGAWDSIADIVGACLALEQLNVAGVSCGPLPAGCGTINCAHGEMPNPAPATQELLAGMSVVQTNEPFELVTPTGAALLRVWCRTLTAVPPTTTILHSAFGFGTLKLNERPNVLRATLLQAATQAPTTSELLILEANLDDANPEWLGGLTAELLERGALDVWYTPVIMKKGRPGTMLTLLTELPQADSLRDWIFRATSTFGIRSYVVQRTALERRTENATTPWGNVPVKIGLLHGKPITAKPEYEVCARIARENKLATRQISQAASAAINHTLQP